MKYTHNWNSEFKSNTNNLGKFNLCLEIGCFEGLTSNYICDRLLNHNGKLICVDPLTDNYLNTDLSEKDVENRDLFEKSRSHVQRLTGCEFLFGDQTLILIKTVCIVLIAFELIYNDEVAVRRGDWGCCFGRMRCALFYF